MNVGQKWSDEKVEHGGRNETNGVPLLEQTGGTGEGKTG